MGLTDYQKVVINTVQDKTLQWDLLNVFDRHPEMNSAVFEELLQVVMSDADKHRRTVRCFNCGIGINYYD